MSDDTSKEKCRKQVCHACVGKLVIENSELKAANAIITEQLREISDRHIEYVTGTKATCNECAAVHASKNAELNAQIKKLTGDLTVARKDRWCMHPPLCRDLAIPPLHHLGKILINSMWGTPCPAAKSHFTHRDQIMAYGMAIHANPEICKLLLRATELEQSATDFMETSPTRAEMMQYVENAINRSIVPPAKHVHNHNVKFVRADAQQIKNAVRAEVISYLANDKNIRNIGNLRDLIYKKAGEYVETRLNERGIAENEIRDIVHQYLIAHTATYPHTTAAQVDEVARKRVIDSREKHEHSMHKHPTQREYTHIRVNFDIPSCHQWLDAPDTVKDLRNMHCHKFKFQVDIAVTHVDRELEFRMVSSALKPEMQTIIENMTPAMRSCERMAKACCHLVVERYGKRDVQCMVSEDGQDASLHCIIH